MKASHFQRFNVLAIALALATCGKASVPKCDSRKAEEVVSTLIIHRGPATDPLLAAAADALDSSTWEYVGQSNAGPIVIAADIDHGMLEHSLKLTFSDERERRYDQGIEKRSCTANIAGAIDSDSLRSAIKLRPFARRVTGSKIQQQANLHVGAAEEGDELWKTDGPNVAITSDQVKEAEASIVQNAGMWMRLSRTWNNPQNYTMQLTEKGTIYITLNE